VLILFDVPWLGVLFVGFGLFGAFFTLKKEIKALYNIFLKDCCVYVFFV